jgi:hypothetical protein
VLKDLHGLMLTDVCENHPMKSFSTCLGNTAAGVMVGSTGLAIENRHKAEVNEMSRNNCFGICYSWYHFRSTRRRKAEELSQRRAG